MASGQPVIGADNRGLRYGDGLFETMRICDGVIGLEAFHFDRLFDSMGLLHFELPVTMTREALASQIQELCRRQGHLSSARVRLMVFRGDGGLYDPSNHFPNYLIQSWPVEPLSPALNSNGLWIGIFEDGRKSMDRFSNIKSNNYLLYAMGALHAKNQQLNDCLILNSHDRVCDSTMANLFCIKAGIVYTPALSEGCVAGVMRRNILERLPKSGIPVREIQMDPGFLLTAQELFLTNAIYRIRFVQRFGDQLYSRSLTRDIYQELLK